MFYDSPLGFRASLGLLHGSIYSVAGNALTDWPVMQALTRAANATAPRRVYVMEQRTKWGNCSAVRNLSFNWRLILAPDFVLRYLSFISATMLACRRCASASRSPASSPLPDRPYLASRGAKRESKCRKHMAAAISTSRLISGPP
jgi:hypothetical protein